MSCAVVPGTPAAPDQVCYGLWVNGGWQAAEHASTPASIAGRNKCDPDPPETLSYEYLRTTMMRV